MKPSGNLYAKLLYLLTAVLLVMMISMAWLLRTNSAYEKTNRALVLQNDSIIAVNIRLMQEAGQQAKRPQNAAAVKSHPLP
jgi:hypothetical protein